MGQAHRCDGCGQYADGSPALRLRMELNPGGRFLGMRMPGGAALDLDFCTRECYEDYDVDGAAARLLAEAFEVAE